MLRPTQNNLYWVSYKTVLQRLYDEYDIQELPEHVVLQHIWDCLNRIGGLGVSKYLTVVDIKDHKFYLPCNLYEIISLTKKIDNRPDPPHPVDLLYSSSNYGAKRNTELERRNYKGTYEDNYVNIPRGERVDYIIDSSFYEDGVYYAKTNVTDIKAYLEYAGLKLDEEGYPMIAETHVPAVLAYIVYRHDYAKFRAGMLLPQIYQESYRQWEEARMLANRGRFNRNELEKALKVLYSYNRNNYWGI
jgi:hypothetical protein